MENFDKKYQEYLNYFEDRLNSVLDCYFNANQTILSKAVKYAVEGGGKRIRPVLCLSVAEALGLSKEDVINFAIAIELIHSYSLVHDDLPSMDNDDFRRGKLSTHKKFGEAYGILTGDALLNLAFEIALDKPNFTQNDVNALRFIAGSSGAKGMVLGQVFDLQSENNELKFTKESLYKIFENKTAKLLIAPVLTSSIVSGNKHYDTLERFAYNLGILFQITDDILDVEGTLETLGKTPNKDEKCCKLTAIKVFGLDKSKEIAKFHYEECKNQINEIPNNLFLLNFLDKIYFRKN